MRQSRLRLPRFDLFYAWVGRCTAPGKPEWVKHHRGSSRDATPGRAAARLLADSRLPIRRLWRLFEGWPPPGTDDAPLCRMVIPC